MMAAVATETMQVIFRRLLTGATAHRAGSGRTTASTRRITVSTRRTTASTRP
jgi:hypothetical protein